MAGKNASATASRLKLLPAFVCAGDFTTTKSTSATMVTYIDWPTCGANSAAATIEIEFATSTHKSVVTGIMSSPSLV